jgi:DNA-binding NtrC family response regulator
MNTIAADGPKTLLAIIELGGYPNFTSLYERAGYRVTTVNSVRKALAALKKGRVDMVVAEFNFQSDFRDRTSSLESLLAVIQTRPGARAVVFYETDAVHQLEKLRARFPFIASLPFPVDTDKLAEAVR